MATVVARVDSATYSCTITGFDLKNIPFPKGATHLKFTYLVCTYDFDALSFVNYESSVFFDSECETVSTFSFTPDLSLTALKNVICFCGISFYQEIGAEKFVLKNTNALGITCVHIGL